MQCGKALLTPVPLLYAKWMPPLSAHLLQGVSEQLKKFHIHVLQGGVRVPQADARELGARAEDARRVLPRTPPRRPTARSRGQHPVSANDLALAVR